MEKIDLINKDKERCERRGECPKNQVAMLKQEIVKWQENRVTEKEQNVGQRESNNRGQRLQRGNESECGRINYADENGNITPGKIRKEASTTASKERLRKLEGNDLEEEINRRQENKGKILVR